MVNEALLSLLVCPLGKAPLRREGDTLVCTRCGPCFSIKDDIPNMLIEEAQLPAGMRLAGQPGVRSIRRSDARLRLQPREHARWHRSLASVSMPAFRSFAIVGRVVFGRLDLGWCSGEQHDGRATVDGHLVAGLHLAALPQLDLAIDPDLAAGNQHLGLAAALNAAAELEHLRQIDWPVIKGDRCASRIFSRDSSLHLGGLKDRSRRIGPPFPACWLPSQFRASASH